MRPPASRAGRSCAASHVRIGLVSREWEEGVAGDADGRREHPGAVQGIVIRVIWVIIFSDQGLGESPSWASYIRSCFMKPMLGWQQGRAALMVFRQESRSCLYFFIM